MQPLVPRTTPALTGGVMGIDVRRGTPPSLTTGAGKGCRRQGGSKFGTLRVQGYTPRAEWRVALDSDDARFGGFARQDHGVNHFTDKHQRLSLYLLPRTVMVLERV